MLEVFPDKLGNAVISEKANAYDSKTIYDYMDGGADPYMRFTFQRLYAASYKLGNMLTVAEVYDMGSSQEAYGIFSTDLKGKSLPVAQGAVYQGTMLRCWRDKYFIKIAGQKDTPEFKDFAVEIAQRFAQEIKTDGPLPALISAIPKDTLHPTLVRYFHTDDDLNNAYYISTDNILGLGKNTEVVFADCRFDNQSLKAAVIRYKTTAEMEKAWKQFSQTYLSKKAVTDNDGTRLEQIRKGRFTGIRRLRGRSGEPMLCLCFETRNAISCRAALAAIVKSASGKTVASSKER